MYKHSDFRSTNERSFIVERRFEKVSVRFLFIYNEIIALSLVNSVRCQQVVERSFDSWNDPEKNRRYRHVKLMADAPSDYEPKKTSRPNAQKRKRDSMPSKSVKKKSMVRKAKAIKCK